MSVTVVGTCWNYGQYLADWADSIAAQTRRPEHVILLEHGSTDDSPAQAQCAIARLRGAGISAELIALPNKLDFGSAKNAAMARVRTEWVAPLDVDDTLMAHALETWESVEDQSDIVAFGYERYGEVNGKPRSGTRTYKSATGIAVVAKFYPASGNWPFRHSLWRQRPYRADLVGAWDTASLIEWAHLGARVTAVGPCFRYRRHSDSVLSRRAGGRGWPLARTNHQIAVLHHHPERAGVSIIVPRAHTEQPERDAAWQYVRQRLGESHPGWEIVEGYSSARRWHKGAAVADALKRASGEILVIADSDCIVPREALTEATDMIASGSAPWVVPHTLVHRLARDATEALLAGHAPDSTHLIRAAYRGFAGGGVVVVGRALYEATGGIPLSFRGWGGEDEALAVILDTLIGHHTRLPYDLTHLWHPPQDRTLDANSSRLSDIRKAAKAGADALWRHLKGIAPPRTESHIDEAQTERLRTEARKRNSFLWRREHPLRIPERQKGERPE